MAATLGKLEARIIISTSTVIGTFVGASVSMPAGNYYLSSGDSGTSFLATLKTQLDAATSRTWTITLDDDSDSSTGKVTLAVSGAATTATWTSTAIRDLLGFAGNLSSGTTWTSDYQAKYLWLPNCGRTNPDGPEDDDGTIETDATYAEGTDGTPYVLAYSTRRGDNMEFPMILGSKCKSTLEVTTNESFATFFLVLVNVGFRFRYYKLRDTDGTYKTWVIRDPGQFKPQAINSNWVGAKSLWNIKYAVRKVP